MIGHKNIIAGSSAVKESCSNKIIFYDNELKHVILYKKTVKLQKKKNKFLFRLIKII